MSREHMQLTPVEVAISTMIRNGLSTKEIAQLRCISAATVRRHRENIRRKLGLKNRRINLLRRRVPPTHERTGAAPLATSRRDALTETVECRRLPVADTILISADNDRTGNRSREKMSPRTNVA